MAAPAQLLPLHDVRERLRAFDFRGLFNDLGWDYLRTTFPVEIGNRAFTIQGIAEKRGVQVLRCLPDDNGAIPDAAMRRRIDREVTGQAKEHVLVFPDAGTTTQIWRWERSEPGKPLRPFEYEFHRGQREELVAQVLAQLFIAIDQEERPGFSIVDVRRQVGGAFEAERVTRSFYGGFQQEHDAFKCFVEGIPDQAERDWYASLMLNRLMFIYFIQKKEFLDGNLDYLRDKLAEVREQRGEGQFHSFYRHFLLKLFHDGLSRQVDERSRELDAILGKVPYLNGGLFDVHALEAAHAEIDIPDEAFERLFAFFDDWRWHLDERPLRNDREINPDVLGYIFEKYINQKQMGAYYTKEDITGYIARNTIIPALFDMARKDVAIAFRPDSALWRLLQENPDRYIYPAMQKGTNLALPATIAAGLHDVAQRGGWNRPAAEAFALPTETWREHVARRQRHDEIWEKLVDGQVSEIDDLITYNLNIHQFAVDAIAECEGPETLRAFWKAIERISVLDPTCGSGAFLFAALNILQPLADACLERMQSFVDETDRAGDRGSGERYRDFRTTLAEVDRHPNREYFVLKQIVLNNLYGVDIMEEAVEICKLRLFLKLVAQVETAEQIEPLPDIDFNIRAGNTLVGFASYEAVERSLLYADAGQMQMIDIIEASARTELQQIDEEAQKSAMAFRHFQSLQSDPEEAATQRVAKSEVRARLAILRNKLDQLQARVYAVDPGGSEYAEWRSRHQPFHWVTEFYEIIHERGGFDVIVGNPPYVEMSEIRKEYLLKGYLTEACGNLFAPMCERAIHLARSEGRTGLIIPVASVCTDSYAPLRQLWRESGSLIISNYNDRPGRLFDGLEHIRLSIVLVAKDRSCQGRTWATKYNKWHTEARPVLFETLAYSKVPSLEQVSVIPKLGSDTEEQILRSIQRQPNGLGALISPRGRFSLYYTRKLSGFLQVLDFVPQIRDDRGNIRLPSELKELRFDNKMYRDAYLALWNSSLFFWWVTITSDCRNLNRRELESIRFDPRGLSQTAFNDIWQIVFQLMDELSLNSEMKTMTYKGIGSLSIQCIFPKNSKRIIDRIDELLARHYELTDEELDFIINYDYKYRMGVTNDDEAA